MRRIAGVDGIKNRSVSTGSRIAPRSRIAPTSRRSRIAGADRTVNRSASRRAGIRVAESRRTASRALKPRTLVPDCKCRHIKFQAAQGSGRADPGPVKR